MTFGGSIGTWLLALVEVNLILARVETGLNKYWLLKHSLSWPIFLRNQTLKNNFNIMNVKSKIQCLFGGKHTSLFEGIILQKMYCFLSIAWCIKVCKITKTIITCKYFFDPIIFSKIVCLPLRLVYLTKSRWLNFG